MFQQNVGTVGKQPDWARTRASSRGLAELVDARASMCILQSMERRRFGSRVEIPVMGQGTWNLELGDRVTAIATLRRGLDLGMTHIDTAEMYGNGAVEEIVGEAIAGRRDEIFLVSKVLPGHASRTGTVEACERSLARLGTDRLDCYLLHWRGEYPLEETIAGFEQLEREGKILHWGVSNFDVPDLEEAREIAGEDRVVCNQVLYHLKERAIEHEVLPWCERNHVAVVGYSPFGHGRFPGPDTPGGRLLRGDRSRARRHPAPGRAAVPGPAAAAVHDPEGVAPRARRRERRRRRPAPDRRRDHPHQRGVPAGTQAARAAHAVSRASAPQG